MDVKAAGLEDFGSEGNYYRRQLKVFQKQRSCLIAVDDSQVWSEQWRHSKVDPVPSMEALIDLLGSSMEEQRRVTIVHGDYRLENVMFHPTQPRIIGVLDWEISTIGDPRADVAYCSLLYHFAGVERIGAAAAAADLRGVPTQVREQANE